MTTPSPNDVLGALLHNDLDVLGDQVINTRGQERIDYWEAFQVGRRLTILRNPESPLLTNSFSFSSNRNSMQSSLTRTWNMDASTFVVSCVN
jgi:hypothetical protein